MTSSAPATGAIAGEVAFPAPHFADVAGTRLAYRTWGTAGEPVLLIHGITSNALSWARVGPALAARYRVYAVDLKGHGDSARPPSGYRLQDQAAECDALLALLGLEGVTVVGHSWGGGIGAALSATSERVRRVVLEDPAIALGSGNRQQASDFYASQVGLSRDAAIAQIGSGAPGWTEVDVAGKVEAMTKGSPEAVRAVFAENRAWDVRDALRGIGERKLPALMVNAERERGGIVSPEVVAAAEHAGFRVVVVPGADHNVHRTQLDAFMRVVEEFLASS